MSRTPAINLPPTILWLALAFIAVHVARQFLDPETDWWVLLTFAFLPARYSALGADLPGGVGADFWTPVTHAFLHADALHLVVNLLWMAGFGTPLARRLGATRFLILTAIGAAAGAGLHYVLYRSDETLLLGASGAISAMMAATARFAFAPGGPLTRGGSPFGYRVPAEPLASLATNRSALFFIAVWFVVNIVFGAISELTPGASGPIAWEAHVGGFIAGFILFSLFDPVPRDGDGLAS